MTQDTALGRMLGRGEKKESREGRRGGGVDGIITRGVMKTNEDKYTAVARQRASLWKRKRYGTLCRPPGGYVKGNQRRADSARVIVREVVRGGV